jgi:hypothetical protein
MTRLRKSFGATRGMRDESGVPARGDQDDSSAPSFPGGGKVQGKLGRLPSLCSFRVVMYALAVRFRKIPADLSIVARPEES